jgi:F-type H+-transporting ATPase subunit b
MDVDWITVAAQIVNFLVLVWLLQRFLYGPIVRAMDAREREIAARLDQAAEERGKAEAEATRYRELQETFEKERDRRLQTVDAEAERTRQDLLAAARDEVAAERDQWQRSIADEQGTFLAEIRERSATAFSDMARQALGDLAGETLEARIVDRFTAMLREMDPQDLEKLRVAVGKKGKAVVVRSAFGIGGDRRTQLATLIREVLGTDVETDFEQSDDIVCGIEMKVPGRVVRWSLDGYLDSLQDELGQAVESRTRGAAGPAKA